MEQRGLFQISAYFQQLSMMSTNDCLYRGHADQSWTLKPSIYRGTKKGIRNRDQLSRWSRIAARFANPVPRNEIEWLVLAQHYGVGTMLLDWTESPLIALFFACYGEQEVNYDGCVWQVRTPSAFMHFQDLDMVSPFKKEREKPGLIWATAMNARTLAQDSAMSLHCSADDRINDVFLKKVHTIPASEKSETLRALKVLGFTRERVFSEISMAVEDFVDSL